MMKKKPIFSIVIPVRKPTNYLRQTLLELKKQTLNSFEVLVITDKISQNPHPSFKRNLGAKMAKGKYLAFLDDDSYPDKNWLKNACLVLADNPNSAAVCGPCLTPPQDDIFQQASGLVWSSFLGSGGAGTYRNSIQPKRFVDDFPSVNLIIKKSDFLNIGGFNQQFWPGEDTLLCLDIVNKLKKTILYHPSIIVFHHRRQVIIPHLQQITRYAVHRGYFAKKFPQTSLKFGYLAPSILLVYCLLLLPLNLLHLPLVNLPLFTYIYLLLSTFIQFILNNNFLVSILAIISIPVTHLYYGALFLSGFLNPNLASTLHRVDTTTNQYIGG